MQPDARNVVQREGRNGQPQYVLIERYVSLRGQTTAATKQEAETEAKDDEQQVSHERKVRRDGQRDGFYIKMNFSLDT